MTISAPCRIQLQRTAGWRKPPNTIVVSRPGRWGNAHVVGTTGYPVLTGGALAPALVLITPEVAVYSHRNQVLADPAKIAEIREHLAGHNLACWCRLKAPCHADTYLLIANCTLAELDWLIHEPAPPPF